MMGTAAQENSVGALPEKATRSDGPPRSRVRRNLIGPLLIMSEEGSRLGGALRVAEAVARRHGVNAHVLSLSRPLSSPSSYLLSRAADLERHELEACRRQAEHARLRRQVHETVGLSSFFSTAVETGELVSTAADTARVRKVEYVLVASSGARARRRERERRTPRSGWRRRPTCRCSRSRPTRIGFPAPRS